MNIGRLFGRLHRIPIFFPARENVNAVLGRTHDNHCVGWQGWPKRCGSTRLGGRIMAGDILYFLHRHFRVVLPATVVMTAAAIVALAVGLNLV